MDKYILCTIAVLVLVLTGCSNTQMVDNTGNNSNVEQKATSGKQLKASQPQNDSIPAGRRMLAEDFSSSLRSGTTIVYFAKISCPACEQQDKIWKKAIKQLPAGVKAEKRFTYAVNYRAYGVTQLPTLVFYNNGVEVSRKIGVATENQIISAAKSAN